MKSVEQGLRLSPAEVAVLGKLLFEVEFPPSPVLGLTEAEYQTVYGLAARVMTWLHQQERETTDE
jgi:hypothetical protein